MGPLAISKRLKGCSCETSLEQNNLEIIIILLCDKVAGGALFAFVFIVRNNNFEKKKEKKRKALKSAETFKLSETKTHSGSYPSCW